MTEMDITAGGQTKVKITVASLGAALILLWSSYNWHFDTFVVKADVPTKAEVKAIKDADAVLQRQFAQHIEDFDQKQIEHALKEVQMLINDTNDKIFALQVFPDDTRRQDQERELRKRLGNYELQKECLLNNNYACD